ncbi:unnamed protein product [Thlaspi arvense]|uniref:FBD domain-containing protein n=1 Tax=Thlaspi arvense TaxID=13288 RepID=A0AAU9SKC6_THLAR|nr:unnamed protein product [Thlaspi arvense]
MMVIRQHCKLEPLPQFCNISRLHAKIFAADLEMLPDLLESCPNLKSIILVLMGFLLGLERNGSIKKEEEISFSSFVPWCLRSSVERVEMRNPVGGFRVKMKLIRYFLENSIVLKKLTLRLGCPRMKQESFIFMELLRFRRCSSEVACYLLASNEIPYAPVITSNQSHPDDFGYGSDPIRNYNPRTHNPPTNINRFTVST